jgi:hypothetical protein
MSQGRAASRCVFFVRIGSGVYCNLVVLEERLSALAQDGHEEGCQGDLVWLVRCQNVSSPPEGSGEQTRRQIFLPIVRKVFQIFSWVHDLVSEGGRSEKEECFLQRASAFHGIKLAEGLEHLLS